MPINFNLEEIRKQHGCSIYFETGLYDSREDISIKKAIDSNFKKIYSVELKKEWYDIGQQIFEKDIKDGRVHLINDDSNHINKYLTHKDFTNKTLFFLDAHFNGENTNPTKKCPLINELLAIKNLPRKDNIILVDDLRLIRNPFPWGETSYGNINFLTKIKEIILEINPNYKFTTLNGHIDDDVLLAYTSDVEKCMYRYTKDYTWFLRSEIKKKIIYFMDKSKENNILEIGCFEGLSSVFFADNLLDHKKSLLTCVDPFLSINNNDHKELLKSNQEENFDYNIKICKNSDKILVKKITSDIFFENNNKMYNFIYIDGCHEPNFIKRDMENSFKFLINDGIMWMDDYRGGDGFNIMNTMNSFLEEYNGHYDVIHTGYQLAIRKKENIFNNVNNIKSDVEKYMNSPYKHIPNELLSKYTLNNKIPIFNSFRNDNYQHNIKWTKEMVDYFRQQYSAVNIRSGKQGNWSYGIYSVTLLLDSFEKYNIRNKKVAVVGSLEPWIEAMLLNFGNIVTTIEYNVPICNYNNLECKDYFTYFKNNKDTFDCIVTFSSVEHSGLGRYGDPLDPDGDIKTMRDIHSNLKSDGLLIWGAPVGHDALVWNIHRIYGKLRLPLIFKNFKELEWFGWDKDEIINTRLFKDGNNIPVEPFVEQPVVVLRKTLEVKNTDVFINLNDKLQQKNINIKFGIHNENYDITKIILDNFCKNNIITIPRYFNYHTYFKKVGVYQPLFYFFNINNIKYIIAHNDIRQSEIIIDLYNDLIIYKPIYAYIKNTEVYLCIQNQQLKLNIDKLYQHKKIGVNINNNQIIIEPLFKHIEHKKRDIKIIDGFMFYNELDLLEFKLKELYDHIDYFIIVESPKTFTGISKELYFKNNKKRYNKYLDKIIHVIFDEISHKNPWVNEHNQRNCIDKEIDKLDLNITDVIINSDCDEIINTDILKKIKDKKVIINCTYSLSMDEYYYNINYKTNTIWTLPKIYSYSEYITYSHEQRYRDNLPQLNKSGWHFSYFGNIEFIQNKINAFSHQEINIEDLNNENHLKNSIEQGFSWNTGKKFEYIDIKDNTFLPKHYKMLIKNYKTKLNRDNIEDNTETFKVIYGVHHQQIDITEIIRNKFYKDGEIVIERDLDFREEFGNIGKFNNYMFILFPNKMYKINEKEIYDHKFIINTKTTEFKKIKMDCIKLKLDGLEVPNWTPSKNSKIYLIANNKSINTDLFHTINEDDLVVCFNISCFIDIFKNHKNKILCMRHGDPNDSWIGYKESIENNYLCTYFVNGSKNMLYNNFKKTKKHINDKIHNLINHKIEYPIDQVPTTGFFVYYFLKKIYCSTNIILLGFNFHSNGNGWAGHNSEWEKEYVKKNNILLKLTR
jgi:beta-1,4-mannosyl-glycoprotein beta-1,4-N-acetylglucosaminyltransferase